MEQDWLCRFREVASNTTTEEIQQLWGRILAGEIKSPGKHSLRTLEFIKNLSPKEAKQIEKLFSFVLHSQFIARSFNGFYDYGSDLLNSKLSFDYLSEMQGLGIISGVEAQLYQKYSPKIIKQIYYYSVWFKEYSGRDDCCVFTHDDRDQELIINACLLTQLGKELYDLCHVEMDADYINYIIKSLEEQGFKKVPKI